MDNTPIVAIAILNFNGKKYLEHNLPFLYNLTYKNTRIFVIDNASSDNSIQWLQMHHPSVNVILNEENLGFAKGYNEGLKQVDCDYFLLLNTDVEVTPSFLEPMIEVLEKNEMAAVCQPKILSQKNRTFFEYAGAGGGMIDQLGYPFARGRLFFTCEQDLQQYDDETEIFWASGACFLIKSKQFWNAGGFYEYYFMQQEEVDLCWRLQTMKQKILYTGKSKVYHLGGGNLEYTNPKKTLLNFRNNWIMLYRNLPRSYFWLYICPRRIVLDVIASLYFLSTTNYANFKAVYKSFYQFNLWRLKHGLTDSVAATMKPSQLTGMLKKSIVIRYFLMGNKQFSDL